MSKKHGTPPDPEKEPLLFPEIGGIEKRGLAALVEAQTRLGKNLSDFLPWYFEHNPAWMQNALWEIVGAAAESFRDFIGRQAAEPIPEPFSVEFRFPVSVSPHSLYVEPPPELDLLEIPPGELAAFRERGHEISVAAVDRILTEKAEEAAREGRTAPEITPEKRAELIRVAEASGEGLIAENAERNLQSDLGEWFTAWRWAFTINAGWSNFRDAGAASEPEAETLCLFHFPDPERAEPDPLWKNSQTFAFRLQTLQALPETGENWQLPECTSPEAMEGKRLFESLCPDGMISRLAIPITALNGETDPDKDTGERRKISFTITLEIHPLTFDFRGEGGAELTEPETYFPLVVRCDRGPGAAGWHELTPEERGDLFRQIIELIESKATPETWDFPGWQPLVADTAEEATPQEPQKRKRDKRASAAKIGREEIKRRVKPPSPKLELAPFNRHSDRLALIQTLPDRIYDPQYLLPLDFTPPDSSNWKEFEVETRGFDFTVPERRVINAMEKLFEAYKVSGTPDKLEIITDIETFAEACDEKKIVTEKYPVARYSGRALCDLLSAVESIGRKRGILIFRNGQGENETTLATTGFLWQPIWQWGKLTPEENDSLKNQIITEAMQAKIRAIGIRLDPIWQKRSGKKSAFYHKPANLRDQLYIAGYIRRTIQTESFLTWLFMRGEKTMHGHREYQNNPEITIPLEQLADICRLPIKKNRKRTIQEITRSAEYAKAIGLITNDPSEAYDAARGVFRFKMEGGEHWKKLHSWQAAEKAEKEARKQEKAAQGFDRRSGKAAAIPADWRGQLKASRDSLRLENERMRKEKEAGRIFDREISKKIERWEADRKALRNRKEADPEARKEWDAMFKEAIQEAKTTLDGVTVPTLPKRPTTNTAPDTEGAEEHQPAPDPATAAVWHPIRAEFLEAFPNWHDEIMAAVPVNLTETGGQRSIGLWQHPAARPWGFLSIDQAKKILARHHASI